MAQLAHSINNELLMCVICSYQYSPQKMPKMLTCHHTFCEPCLREMVKRTRQAAWSGHQASGGQASGGLDEPPPAGQVDEIKCPVCREVTTLKRQGVQELANNLTILTLMDMMAKPKSPGHTSSPTRNRLDSPEEGLSRCVQCNRRFPESQFLCGHCICDKCLHHCFQDSRDNDNCPVCRPPHRDQLYSRSRGTDVHPEGATGASASASCRPKQTTSCRPKQTTPVPAPRSLQKQPRASSTPTGGDYGKSPPKPPIRREYTAVPRHEGAGGADQRVPRPPPFNPSYLKAPGHGASSARGSSPEITSSSVTSQKRSISPYGAAAAATSEQTGYSRFADPDNLSLCSVASESRVSPAGSDLQMSTLRRTQSMRRPPPPPQRKHGTLPRHTLSPPRPPPAVISRSAENVRDHSPMAASVTHSRQRNSLSEGPSAPVRLSPPAPPPRRIFKNQSQSPTRCVKKFGSYSEVSLQTSGFRKPSRIALSEKGDIVVSDTRNMTVQLFTLAGDYVCMFKVLGVQDTCFLTPDKLCVASHMGVHVYTSSGHKLADIQIGATVAVAPYKFGFIAATPKCLHIYTHSLTLVKEMAKFKSVTSKKWSPIHKKTQVEFHSIRDIAVTPTKSIVVLDGGLSWTIYILAEDGACSAKIDPTSLPCGPLSDPAAITTDFGNNIYVSDTEQHRLLKFTATGAFQRCVVSFSGREPNTKRIFPRAISVIETGHVIVGITGDHIAEVRVYNQV